MVDDFTRECLALVADTSLPGLRVVRELEAIVARRGRPASIARTWIVLPRPMSSAKHPPNPNRRKKDSQPRPAS